MLRNLSIKQLLYYWSLGCSLIIIVLTVALVGSNEFLKNRQSNLLNRTVTIEESSRNIIRAVGRFVLRQSNIMSAVSVDELEQYTNRKPLEKQLNRPFQKIKKQFSKDSEANTLLQGFGDSYREFLFLDENICNIQHQSLLLKQELGVKTAHLEKLVTNISNAAENISGIINLEESRTRRQLRSLLSQGTTLNWQFYEGVESVFMGDRARIQKASSQVQRSVGIMVQLSQKITQEKNKDALISVRDNEILQQANHINTALTTLKVDLDNRPELMKKINYLELSINALLNLLIENSYDSSIYELRLRLLSLQDELELDNERLDTKLEEMIEQLEQLSRYATRMTHEAGQNTEEIYDFSKLAVTVVSIMVTVLLLLGIKIVMNRINKPLFRINNAMTRLAEGELDVKLKTNEFSSDEFLEVAQDFNRFSSSNQATIEELSKARDALQDSEHRTRAILENALVGIAHLKDRKFISVNTRFEEMFGYQRGEILGRYTEILFSEYSDFAAVGEAAYSLLEQGENYASEWQVKRKNGDLFWCAISAKSIVESEPEKGTIWLYEDITVKRESVDELKRLANFDTLTGLPNRSLFMDRLTNNLERAKRKNEKLVVMYIDLDRFKQVNDSLGHSAGDDLLCKVADRLLSCVRTSDTVSRLGGDEFTVLLNDVRGSETIARIANNIINSLNRPIVVDEHEVIISPSIGISLYPDDGDNVSTILKNSDAAMYSAKAAGRNNYQFYTETMNAESLQKLSFESKLRRVVEQNQLMIYYQPLVDAQSSTVVGYEALLRWYDKEMGMVSPVEFIPVLEETGLISSVGEWVFETACQTIHDFSRKKGADIRISINLSARQFLQRNLVGKIKSTIEKIGISPELIDLEITESILMDDPENSQRLLSELSKQGMRISLDDFGTGYSSLAYLKRFPIDVIKIDRTFVRDILTDPSDAAICEAILAMANSLDMAVTAEGVETAEQLEFLKDKGCKTVQGYYLGRPAPIEEAMFNSGEMNPDIRLLE